MTPLEYAQEVLKLAEQQLIADDVAVPGRTWAQLGQVVLECEALVASVPTANSFDLGDNCAAGQVATVLVSIARDCANVFDDDGVTIIPAQEQISAQQDADGQALWDLAQQLETIYVKTWSIDYVITGNLAITTLSLTIGIL